MTRVNSLRGNSFKEQHQRAKKCSEREEQKKPPCDTEYVNVMKIKCRKNHKNNSKKNARCQVIVNRWTCKVQWYGQQIMNARKNRRVRPERNRFSSESMRERRWWKKYWMRQLTEHTKMWMGNNESEKNNRLTWTAWNTHNAHTPNTTKETTN